MSIMEEVDINTLVNNHNYLNEDIPNNIIIIGKIDGIIINKKFDKLDLSDVECKKLYYRNQKGDDIKNHILPNSLIILNCSNNELTSLPKLPNSLKKLSCYNNQLTSLPKLPNSLKKLLCSHNKLTSFANNQLSNSLKFLYCANNQITSLPDFSNVDHNIELRFNQDLPISYIPYNPYLKLSKFYHNKINIIDYPQNPITNQDKLDQYMDYVKNYQLNRIKSARK